MPTVDAGYYWAGTVQVAMRPQHAVLLPVSRTRQEWNWSFGNSTEAARPIASNLLSILGDLYTIQDSDYCLIVLNRYPRLYDVLVDAYFRIREVFGKSQLRLERFSDFEGNAEQLFIIVPTKLPVAEARSTRRRLDQSWWLTVTEPVAGILNYDVEYA